MTTDHSVTANFAIDQHTVNASVNGGHGTVVETTQSIDYGANATIHITPDANYHIASITDNGTPVAIINPYVINNVRADHEVVVIFAQNFYFYFAEGYTGAGFDEYLCLLNPNTAPPPPTSPTCSLTAPRKPRTCP